MNTLESFYDPEAPIAKVTDAMVEVPSHNFVKARLVADNPHIVSQKSTATLKVVH